MSDDGSSSDFGGDSVGVRKRARRQHDDPEGKGGSGRGEGGRFSDDGESAASASASSAAVSTTADEGRSSPLPGPIVVGGTIDFPLGPVRSRLVCGLCHGYFRDPYTVAECLHTFCKSCLFFTFRSGYRRCPECETSLEPDPFKEVLSDRTLQEIVDKIFPHLREQDDADEREFYARRGIPLKPEYAAEEAAAASPKRGRGSRTDRRRRSWGVGTSSGAEASSTSGGAAKKRGSAKTASDEMNFNLFPDNAVKEQCRMASLQSPQLRTSGRLKVVQIKKYLLKKLQLKAAPAAVDVLCNGDPLGDELSLTFIQRTRWLHPTDDLVLTYRFSEEGIY